MEQSPFQPLFTPTFIAEALNLPPPSISQPFNSITTDSRKIQKGCLFVAIPGEKMDGHQFIDSAITQGAAGILCRKTTPQPQGDAVRIPHFRVEDTLMAYRKIAGAWRRQFSLPLVMVAGSVGKTTSKELLTSILSGKFKSILKTQGSQNGFLGIAMTLLELRPHHQAAVVEVGIDEIGAMEQHLALIAGNASIVTAIGPEHLEKLRDIPTVAQEEGIALTFVAKAGGTVAVNLDDPWIRPHMSTLRGGKKIGYTLDEIEAPSGAQVLRAKIVSKQTELKVEDVGTFPLPLPGVHNARNLLGAIAIAHGLGLSASQMREGLQNFKGVDGRSEIKALGSTIQVLCDYYNANPTSMVAAFETLTQMTQRSGDNKSRWACIGDMLELGPGEEKFHRDLADKLIDLGIEHVLLYGPRMRVLFEELKRRVSTGSFSHFSSHSELASALAQGVQSGDTILIKGSRGMKMEEVWSLLQKKYKG